MWVLFDNGTPKQIEASLAGHQVSRAAQLGWGALENGELIAKAEAEGYEVLLSTDKNIKYQQNLGVRRISLVVLGNQNWPLVRPYLSQIVAAVNSSKPGTYVEVPIPFRRQRKY